MRPAPGANLRLRSVISDGWMDALYCYLQVTPARVTGAAPADIILIRAPTHTHTHVDVPLTASELDALLRRRVLTRISPALIKLHLQILRQLTQSSADLLEKLLPSLPLYIMYLVVS